MSARWNWEEITCFGLIPIFTPPPPPLTPLPASSLVTRVLLSPQCEKQSVWGGQKRLHCPCEIQRAAHSPLFVAIMRAISPFEQAMRERMAIRDARARRFPTSPQCFVADSRVLSRLASLSKTKWRYIFAAWSVDVSISWRFETYRTY